MSLNTCYIQVRLDQLKIDPKYQARESLDMDHVEDLKEFFLSGSPGGIHPLDVFDLKGVYYVVDGYHRFTGALAADVETLPCKIHQGTETEAIEFAAQANKTHGLKRTNTAKRRSVEMVLALTSWQRRSDRMIADHCGVSDKFVAKVREESTANGSQLREGRDGKKRTPPTQKGRKSSPGDLEDENSNTNQDRSQASEETQESQGLPQSNDLPTSQEKEPTLVDANGIAIPDKCLKVFLDASDIQGELKELRRISNKFDELKKADNKAYSCVHHAHVKAGFKELLSHIRPHLPKYVCRACHGQKNRCQTCSDSGWMSQVEWEASKPR